MLKTKLSFLTVVLAVVAAFSHATPAYASSFDQNFMFDGTCPQPPPPTLDAFVPASPSCTFTSWNNSIEINVLNAPTGFNVAVSALEMTPSDFAAEAGAFASDSCLPYLSDGNCVEYRVTPNEPLSTAANNIQVTIRWLMDTNAITTSPFIIQAEGNDPYTRELGNNVYYPCGTTQTEGTANGQSCTPISSDPADSGTTDNFSRFAVADTNASPVPEPATLTLMGLGLAAYNARRKWARG
jgi:hypothetical protein